MTDDPLAKAIGHAWTALAAPGAARVEPVEAAEFEERAAILEFEAGIPRADAERLARAQCGEVAP